MSRSMLRTASIGPYALRRLRMRMAGSGDPSPAVVVGRATGAVTVVSAALIFFHQSDNFRHQYQIKNDQSKFENESSSSRVLRPRVPVSQDFAVSGHPRFGGAGRIRNQQFDPHNLFDAVIAKVRILWRERSFRIDPRDDCFDRMPGIRIDVNTRRLAQLDAPNVAFGHKSPQIDSTEVKHSHDRCAGRNYFAGLRSSGRNRAVKRRDDSQIVPVCRSFFLWRARTISIGLSRIDVRLGLRNLSLYRSRLR